MIDTRPEESDAFSINSDNNCSNMSVDKNDKLDFRNPTLVEDVKDGKQKKSPSRNLFSERRTFVQNLCDVSVLAANASQLRAVIEGGSQNTYYWPLIIMICLSILSHIVFGFLLIQRWRKEREAELEHKKKSDLEGKSNSDTNVQAVTAKGIICPCSPCQSVERCDEISMNIMFLIVVLNVAVAGLGLTPS
ncbi:ninjurin-1-like [Saccostrea cucullata]|uniref:ninjurin-1-like n=1 Tax=Saccostrea cuccullata TaxID=36930 RepID=UPI002ED62A2E